MIAVWLLGGVVSVTSTDNLLIQHCVQHPGKQAVCFIEGLYDDKLVIIAKHTEKQIVADIPWPREIKIDQFVGVDMEQYERLRVRTAASFAYVFDDGQIAVGMMGTTLGQVFSADAWRSDSLENIDAIVNMPTEGNFAEWDPLAVDIGEESIPGHHPTPTDGSEFLPAWSDKTSQLIACDKSRCALAVVAGAMKGAQRGWQSSGDSTIGITSASAEDIFNGVWGGIAEGIDTLVNHEACQGCIGNSVGEGTPTASEQHPAENDPTDADAGEPTLSGDNVGDAPTPTAGDPLVATPDPDATGMTAEISRWHESIKNSLLAAQKMAREAPEVQARDTADQPQNFLQEELNPLIIFALDNLVESLQPAGQSVPPPPQPTTMDPPEILE